MSGCDFRGGPCPTNFQEDVGEPFNLKVVGLHDLPVDQVLSDCQVLSKIAHKQFEDTGDWKTASPGQQLSTRSASAVMWSRVLSERGSVQWTRCPARSESLKTCRTHPKALGVFAACAAIHGAFLYGF